MNLEGQELLEEFSGFTAVIIQHEVDHLNGKVFVHRIKNEKDLHLVFPSEINTEKIGKTGRELCRQKYILKKL